MPQCIYHGNSLFRCNITTCAMLISDNSHARIEDARLRHKVEMNHGALFQLLFMNN